MSVAVRLRWLVEDLAVVMASYDQVMVKRSTVGIGGPYTEITAAATRIDLQTGKTLYEYVDAGGDAAYYYRVTWHDSGGVVADDDQDPFLGEAATGMYCQVEDLRAEGITVAMLSDANAVTKIKRWSKYIERCTGRWFEPRARAFILDGDNSLCQRIPHPIIRIDALATVSGRGSEYQESEVSVDGTRVYNRHLTQGLDRPDDRDAPRIEMPLGFWWNEDLGVMEALQNQVYFPAGRLNLKVEGIFGFTELDPDDSVGETSQGSQVPLAYGRTPDLIKQATMLLVLRDMPLLLDFGFREELRGRWSLTSEKTADQSYTRANPGAIGQAGAWTGDPQIDSLLAVYASTLTNAEVI